MGSPFTLVFYSDDEKVANRALSLGFSRIAQLDKVLSDYDSESETNHLCGSAPHAEPLAVSDDLFEVILKAQKIYEQSEGKFDVTVGPLTKLWRRARRQKEAPSSDFLGKALSEVGMDNLALDDQARRVQLRKAGMRLDFGGIGQGYAVDEVMKIFAELGLKRCLVNASGDVAASEPPPGEMGWRVALVGLQPKTETPKEYVLLRNGAITTSGDAFQFVEINGKRYSHIVDPATGMGLERRISATVFAPQCTQADAWATALCILPKEKGFELLQKAVPGSGALVVESINEKSVETVTADFPPRLAVKAKD